MPFPLLIPVVLGLASAALGAAGVKKGFDAKKDFEDAKDVGERAQRKYSGAQQHLNQAREDTQHQLEALGAIKLRVFEDQIGYLVNVLKKGRSQISGFETDIGLNREELRSFEGDVLKAADVSMSLGSSAAAGAMAGMGAFGLVGSLATASTGTAIASLSGVAATNATLAWLGGGSLAAGGMGMAAGTWVLGGVVAGPALAIGGFMLASKAEEALTEARAYQAKVEVACEEMQGVREVLAGIDRNIEEMQHTISQMVERFEQVKTNDIHDEHAMARMVQMGRALRELLNIPVIDAEGAAAQDLHIRISGAREIAGHEAS
ncbi:MAG: hypothetical protein AB7S56_07380 [Halothiobacillaceae bacterium]